jgi:glycerophosphoryl diester phosphodiesterase
VIAHRGASAHAPENTLAAFELALKQGADAIEMDVDLCQDGHLIVIHDRSVNRTTEGSGFVRDMPLSALKELDAGSHFDIAFKGEPIPTLDEVFELLGKRVVINLELKQPAVPVEKLTEKVAISILRHSLIGSVIVSSFYPAILRSLRKILPDVALALLTLHGIKGALLRSWFGEIIAPHQAIHPDFRDVTPGFVKWIRNTGRRLNAYTVNTPDDMVWLINLGIDGIITDDPLMAKRVVRSMTPIMNAS